MARKKVLLRYIQNAAARKTSCVKRRRSLLKKVEELSILCDIMACVVIFGEDPNEPSIHWPEERARVEEVMRRFEACPDERKRVIAHESFVDQMIGKYEVKLKRLNRMINEYEMYEMMYLVYVDKLCHAEFRVNELQSLRKFTAEKIMDLRRKAEFMVKEGKAPTPPSPHPAAVPPAPPPPPPPSTFLGWLFLQGSSDNSTEEARAIVPNPIVNEASRCSGGYIGDIPGIQNLMPGGIVGGPSSSIQAPLGNIFEADAGSADPASTTRDVEDHTRRGGSGR